MIISFAFYLKNKANAFHQCFLFFVSKSSIHVSLVIFSSPKIDSSNRFELSFHDISNLFILVKSIHCFFTSSKPVKTYLQNKTSICLSLVSCFGTNLYRSYIKNHYLCIVYFATKSSTFSNLQYNPLNLSRFVSFVI
jgi:hypothetical protein